MSKKKRNKKAKGRSKGSVADSGWERVWNDVEETFFASAPPDQAEPPAAPECFDDLAPNPSPREAATWATWDKWSGRAIRPRVAAIALASVAILLGLTAVVFASLG
jgi:hypothetical protein